MLVALNETEKIINLLDLVNTDLVDLEEAFLRCPACKSQVRLKNGRVKMPHFAHVSLAACQYVSENESLQHLTLKNRLYHWFKQTDQVKIEHFLPTLQQTPDLLVNERIAIEIQCSPLSIQRLRERTETYRSHGYTVLWLMGKDLWLGQHCLSDWCCPCYAGDDVSGRIVCPASQHVFTAHVCLKVYPSECWLYSGLALLADVDGCLGVAIYHHGDHPTKMVSTNSDLDLVCHFFWDYLAFECFGR